MGRGRVLLLEMNELSPDLLHRFLREGRLPGFARMRRESLVRETAAAERAPLLEPWIQWVTLHTGLSQAEHGVLHLDEGARVPGANVWEEAAREGLPVWVCGAMNARSVPGLKGALLPDPWTTDVAPEPAELQPFARFVQSQVQEYTNERRRPDLRATARFGAFVAGHGLSFATARAIALQLATERLRGGKGAWRRAALLDRILFDVFKHYYRRVRPGFASVFANCVAHYQHLYWRDFDPGAFQAAPRDVDGDRSEAIAYGFETMDGIVSEALDMAGPDTTVVLATALSQSPCVKYEAIGGMRFYRPRDVARLAELAELPLGFRSSAVMSNEVVFHYDDAQAAEGAVAGLTALRVGDERAMNAEATGGRVVTHLRIKTDIPENAVLTTPRGTKARLFDLFYKVDATKSGIHDPRGLLWIRTPRRDHAELDVLPLTGVAPILRELLGVPH